MRKKYIILILLLVVFSNSVAAQNRVAVKGDKEIVFGGLFDVRHYKESGPFEFELGNLELSIQAKLGPHVHLIAKGEFSKEGAKLGEDVHILFNLQSLASKSSTIVNFRFGRFIPSFGKEGMRSRRRITVQLSEMSEFLGISADDGIEISLGYKFLRFAFATVNGTPNTQKDELDYINKIALSFNNFMIDFFTYQGIRHQEIYQTDIDTKRIGGALEYYDGFWRFQYELIKGEGALNEVEKPSGGIRVVTPLGVPFNSLGYYVLGGFKIVSRLELVGKYSFFDYDTEDDANMERERLSGTLIYKLADRSYAKIEGVLNWEEPEEVNNHNFVAQLIVEF